jgi:hypothetical protein
VVPGRIFVFAYLFITPTLWKFLGFRIIPVGEDTQGAALQAVLEISASESCGVESVLVMDKGIDINIPVDIDILRLEVESAIGIAGSPVVDSVVLPA